ncbi:MAG: transporter substrate-binding domain-containing protein [Planctomycetia bacterium]|nr:transporter substrate-binding domain-containing protein [Planctomycetia bacterium]
MRSPARPLVAGLLALVLASALVACGRGAPPSGGGDLVARSTVQQVVERGELVVLMEAQFKPFTYKEDGVLKGFDVDLARALADELGVKVRFEEREWGMLATELLQGKGDLVISGITATPKRALTAAFSAPYFLTRTIALVGVPSADGITSVRQLDAPGRTVVAQGQSTGEVAARKHLPKAKLLTFPTEAACVLEVVQGRADAFVYDEWQIREHARLNPGRTRVLEETLSVEPYGIEFRRGDPETAAWLDLALRTMRLDGRLAALFEKHLPGIAVPAELAPPR